MVACKIKKIFVRQLVRCAIKISILAYILSLRYKKNLFLTFIAG